MNLETQFDTALIMIGMGICFGMMLEVYRRIRPAGKVWPFFTDALFWSSYAIFVFYKLYQVNQGFVKISFFFFLALGFTVYIIILRRFFLPILDAVFFCIRTIYRTIAAIIRIFLVIPLVFVARCMVSLARMSHFLLSWMVKVLILRPWTAATGRLKK